LEENVRESRKINILNSNAPSDCYSTSGIEEGRRGGRGCKARGKARALGEGEKKGRKGGEERVANVRKQKKSK